MMCFFNNHFQKQNNIETVYSLAWLSVRDELFVVRLVVKSIICNVVWIAEIISLFVEQRDD